jgi:hypothetical protein
MCPGERVRELFAKLFDWQKAELRKIYDNPGLSHWATMSTSGTQSPFSGFVQRGQDWPVLRMELLCGEHWATLDRSGRDEKADKFPLFCTAKKVLNSLVKSFRAFDRSTDLCLQMRQQMDFQFTGILQ